MTATAQARGTEGLISENVTRAPRPSWLETARAFFASALAEPPAEGVLAITVPAAVTKVEAPLRALRKGPTWIFAPADGVATAATGAAMQVRARGERRFDEARVATTQMLERVTHRAHGEALVMPLRAFVGFAFAPGAADEAPWSALGDALVTLPRWTYAVDGARASLTFAADCRATIDPRLVLAELEAMLEAIERARPASSNLPNLLRTDHANRPLWSRGMEAIRDAIHQGEVAKVVAARRSVVTTERDIEPLDVFARLSEAQNTTRFLVRAGSTTFVGATPEHLFTRRGSRLMTEALAGSIAADVAQGEAQLLASEKDRAEHEYVVHHIVERLGPLAQRIVHAETPRVRRLATVAHLHTPIEAELRAPVHPIDVIAALHPTPAVGGTPVERAVPWILEHELPRGWYSAPLGWIDARGDAEFVVALRCGVVQGARAWLWAGGGIVAASNPDAEWDEAALKMRPMLRALGAR